MIEFISIEDDNPALAHSPMVRAIEMLFAHIAEHGPIGLTPSKAFKRVFVHWAAANFDWPGYSEEELFVVNKVLNEMDFRPLMEIHDLLIALKIGRHFKNSFRLTKAGQSLIGHPGQLFGIITPFFLFETDHLAFSRQHERPLGNWDVYLNVLNVEAENGASGRDLDQVFFGANSTTKYSYDLSNLYVQILRPLCWTGLLSEHRTKRQGLEEGTFTKTPLWYASLRLDTDDMVKPATRH
jgi:hypothetical protein